MAFNSKVISDCKKVLYYLNELKSKASDDPSVHWWKKAIKIEWNNIRKGNNSTLWSSIVYTDSDGVSGNLVLRLIGERHSGQIMPNTDAALAELVASSNASRKFEKRTKKPCIQIQQWQMQVKTAEDGITPLTDASGAAILPPDSMRSNYYAIAALVNEAFTTEVNLRIDNGRKLVKTATEMKTSNKLVTASAVIAAFGNILGGDLILDTSSTNAMRKLFQGKEFEIITKGVITTSNIKVAELVQTRVSDSSPKNSGCELPNPMTRIGMDFNKETGVSKIQFFDKQKPFMTDGKKKFEAATVDGVPINADNIHKAIGSNTIIDGIADMSAVCFSSMGISIPVSVVVAVVERTRKTIIDFEDIYETAESSDVTAVTSAVVTAVTSAVSTVAEENYDALLQDLTGGDN